ncbi:Uncharacterized protein PECH_006083 [Penicillium ucsense]|uniref:HTH APSES-type domain-containing protein n=1 Tax=Penicillium ucsense TaxID=2839758 RepID=A0A8J8WGE9_9EURO|nr:Uncharacterized protein PECM_007253 [Penicillium ucsense]KAF7735840.1 Uncharacterized protein PECH_006083 [Penicillium ucsense]
MPSSQMVLAEQHRRPPKPKIAKDKAVFQPGPIQGELRYPPHEDRTPFLEEEHRKAKLTPYGNIADYPRHIPYQSEKKTFLTQTGRDCFHVFQYTFQRPGVDAEPWTVTWDYNIGLVRTTHLFKCLGHAKTAPARVLNNNLGLREISHSITGGSLAAQGYWMPFEAAKAIAATFCWEIRFLLTPIFGLDFPELCVPPDDHFNFNRMIIDPRIVQEAAELSRRYRLLERLPTTQEPSPPPHRHLPVLQNQFARPVLILNAEQWDSSSVSSRVARHRYDDSASSMRGSSSEPYSGSPHSPAHHGFTPINRPPSSHPALSESRSLLNEASARRLGALTLRLDGSDSDAESAPVPRSHPPRRKPDMTNVAGVGRDSADADSELGDDLSTSPDDSTLMDEDENEDDEEYRGPRHASSSLKYDAVRDTSETKRYPSRNGNGTGHGNGHGNGNGHADEEPQITPPSIRIGREIRAAHALLHMHMQRASCRNNDGDSDENNERGLEQSAPEYSLASSNPRSRKRRRVSI